MAEQVVTKPLSFCGGVANASYGLPDLGMTSLSDVLEDVRRITSATEVPLLVDIDTWGGAFNIARTIREMTQAGAAAVHIEDQVAQSAADTGQTKPLCRWPRWLTGLRRNGRENRRWVRCYGSN